MTKPNRSQSCGFGTWFRPAWLQSFATTKSFLCVYGLLGTIQAMSYVYWIATLTTFEKRFRIPSKTTGIMLSGNEISQILLSLILTYFGGQRNRPLWIAWGVAFSAASCYVLALPHLIYGPGETALSLTKEYSDENYRNGSHNPHKDRLGLCSEEWSEDCQLKTGGEFSNAPALLVFLSQFILGIGSTLYFALGQTYLDDNTKKEKTPMYLGVALSLRTVGPAFGFVFGYACLSLYIDPTLTPVINRKDPRWLGAWWLGWLLLGTVMFLFSAFISMFPKQLCDKKKQKECEINDNKIENDPEKNMHLSSNGKLVVEVPEKKPPTIKDFPKSLKRIIKNKLLVINIFSGVFYILGASGYMTYLTKYMEVQFSRTAAGASLIIGPVTLFSFVAGFLVSGIVISRFKPRPFYLLGWNVIVGCFYIFAEIIFIFLSCTDSPLVGYNVQNNSIGIINQCNNGCGCTNLKYAPVCLEEAKLTFYTACHAGCKSFTTEENGTKIFSNCSCIPNEPVEISGLMKNIEQYQYSTYTGKVIEGACSPDCGYNFILFILISLVMHSIGSSGRIGNILVNYRAVKPDDKAFAQGLSLLLISLLAFIPGPILFGYIIDSTCLIWDESCGSKGNCWFYDKKAFRFRLNTTSAALTTIGVVLDGVVCYLGKELNIYDDEPLDYRSPEKSNEPTRAVESDNEENPLKNEYLTANTKL